MKEILRSKLFKITLIIFIVILLILFITFLFLKLWIPFGGTPTKADKKEYAKRASNYKDGKFHNEHEFKMIYNDNSKNEYLSTKNTIPKDRIPIMTPTMSDDLKQNELNFTWLGHSSLWLQMHDMNILFDPVFSERSSPVSFVGPKRFSDSPIKIADLPTIDILIISHDHYDHLDYNTIKEIDSKVKQYVVPLGVENHLERWGVDNSKIITMAWWEEIDINGLKIVCAPARHYSSRNMVFDSFNTLWSSWILMDDNYKVYNSGDSGFDNHFEQIHDKYGSFDLAFIEAGQYNSKWKSTHMTPEESVSAGQILEAKYIVPIHWGAFVLAEHPWDDSVMRFIKKASELDINYLTPMIGQTINYGNNMETNNWWEEIN